MARNVGSIEVTVDANTGRLTAQLNKAGKQAGTAFKLAAEKEMRNLQATIDFATEEASTEAKILRQRIEAQLAGIPLDVDLGEARAKLMEFAEEAERLDLVLDLRAELTDRDLAEIEADYGAWKAQIEEDAINASISLATSEMLAEAHEAKMQIEADDINIKASISLATSEMLAEAWEAKQQIEADKIRMGIELQTALAIAEAEGVEREIEQMEAEMQLDLDTKKATLAKFRFKETTEDEDIEFQATLSTLRAQVGMDDFILKNMARDLGLNLDVDYATETAKYQAWKRAIERQKIDIQFNFEEDKAKAAAKKASEAAEEGFDFDFLSGRMKGIIGAVTLLIEPATEALAGLASAGIAVVGSASIAAVAGVTAFGAAIGGLAITGGALVISLEGMKDAVTGVKDAYTLAAEEGRAFDASSFDVQTALKDIAPGARDFALALGEVMSKFDAVQQRVQGAVFDDLGDSVRNFTEKALPAMEKGLVSAGRSLNEFFDNMINTVAEIDFDKVFGALKPAVDDLLQVAVELAGTLEPFLLAAAPAAAELAKWILSGAESLREFVTAGEASGSIAEFLAGGIDSLKLWGSLIGEITGALGTLFAAGKGSGDALVSSLTGVVTQFNDWMKSFEGQTALQDFFQLGIDTVKAFGPVVDGLREGLGNIVTDEALGRLTSLGESIGDILPAIGTLINIVGSAGVLQFMADMLNHVGDVVEEQGPKFQKLADTIGDSLASSAELIAPLFDDIGEILGAAAEALSEWGEAIRPVAEKLLPEFVEIVDALTPILVDLIGIFADIAVAMVPFIDMFADIVAFGSAGLGVLEDVYGILKNISGLAFGGLPAIGKFIGGLRDGNIETKFNPDFSFDKSSAIKAGAEAQRLGASAFSNTAELGNAATAAAALADAYDIIGTSAAKAVVQSDALAQAKREESEALVKAGQDAMKSVKAAEALADKTERVAIAAVSAAGGSAKGAAAFIELGDGARDAADAADALSSALDTLLNPFLDVQEAESNLHASFDDLTQSIKDNGATLDLHTEKGRANAEQVRTGITSITDFAAAQLASGVANEEVAATAEIARAALVEQATAFFDAGHSADEARFLAEGYINSLGLTPELISTVFSQPGLVDALLNASDLTLLYDEAGNPVISEFMTQGIPLAMSEVEGFQGVTEAFASVPYEAKITADVSAAEIPVETIQGQFTELDGTDAQPVVSVPSAVEVGGQIIDIQTGIDALGNTVVTPVVKLPSSTTVRQDIEMVQAGMDLLNATTAVPTVNTEVNGYQDVLNLDRAIDNLPTTKTITIRTNNVTTNSGGMAGRMINGPQTLNVGERGLREALVPLDLPLSRVNPEVRMMAALLRGEGPSRTPVAPVASRGGPNITQYFTLPSADPAAVATQVLNRSAVLANR